MDVLLSSLPDEDTIHNFCYYLLGEYYWNLEKKHFFLVYKIDPVKEQQRQIWIEWVISAKEQH